MFALQATLTAHNELLVRLLSQPPALVPPLAVLPPQANSEGHSTQSPQSSGGAVSGLNDR